MGEGGQDQKRQSLEREIRLFAEIGLFLSQKQAFSKKKVFTGFGVFSSPKNQRSLKKNSECF